MARIAVVNDDTAFLDLVSELLALEGHDTLILRESRNAFERISEALPDLVILDIRMNAPENGWTVCELLKLDPRTRHLPIIVCSAAITDLRDRAAWLEEHSIGALPKPFDIDDLYDSVRVGLETGKPDIKGL